MQKLYQCVHQKRKLVLVISYAYIIFISCCLFPIVQTNTQVYQNISLWLVRLLTITVYIDIANLFYGLYEKRPLFVFCFTFVLNAIGLFCRIFLEWGEATITRDLTPLNVGIHLFMIPIFITIVYMKSPLLNHKKRVR